jgi:ribosomal protein S18 acetylase RimI-like enzyme
MQSSVTLRSVSLGDEPFLFALYASTRLEELAQVGWDRQQQENFLRMQFHAQTRYYESEYPGADFRVILVAGEAAGRLYVHRREREIRIMDICLLPHYRGKGIGSSLLQQILSEGAEHGKPVTIHVEVFNPALRLYERLGFRKIASNGLYDLMEWLPHRAPTASVEVAEAELRPQCA